MISSQGWFWFLLKKKNSSAFVVVYHLIQDNPVPNCPVVLDSKPVVLDSLYPMISRLLQHVQVQTLAEFRSPQATGVKRGNIPNGYASNGYVWWYPTCIAIEQLQTYSVDQESGIATNNWVGKPATGRPYSPSAWTVITCSSIFCCYLSNCSVL